MPAVDSKMTVIVIGMDVTDFESVFESDGFRQFFSQIRNPMDIKTCLWQI